jgi:putative transposase
LESPVYFVTACTHEWRTVLATGAVADILIDEWRAAEKRHGWLVGRYVIMPDHVHFFCATEHNAKTLSVFVGAWKEWTSKRITREIGPVVAAGADRGFVVGAIKKKPRSTRAATAETATKRIWQREFFDHVLRSEESYAEKWEYVRQNPVRAGVAASAEERMFQGEIHPL